MSLIKAFCIAFSTYSKIPMPQFEWKEKDMRYHLIFFPLIGAVIGAGLYGWGILCRWLELPEFAFTLVAAVIPIFVTGGFHVDGFMDTMDAWKSYKSKEEKLKIMKDPHIGAFSVIMLALYGMVYLASVSLLNRDGYLLFAVSFAVARILSALTVMTFPHAKEEGMLYTMSGKMNVYPSSSHEESKTSGRRLVIVVLILELMVCAGWMIWKNAILGVEMLLADALLVLYYDLRTRKELGGITGDTAGYFVVCSEVLAGVVAAVHSNISG